MHASHFIDTEYPSVQAGVTGPLDDHEPGCGVGGGCGSRLWPAGQAEEGVQRHAELELTTNVDDAGQPTAGPVGNPVERPRCRDFDEHGGGQGEPFRAEPEHEHARAVRLDRSGRLLEDLPPDVEIAGRSVAVEKSAGGLGEHRAVAAVDEGGELGAGLVAGDADRPPAFWLRLHDDTGSWSGGVAHGASFRASTRAADCRYVSAIRASPRWVASSARARSASSCAASR